jgi:hypothetical protein
MSNSDVEPPWLTIIRMNRKKFRQIKLSIYPTIKKAYLFHQRAKTSLKSKLFEVAWFILMISQDNMITKEDTNNIKQ